MSAPGRLPLPWGRLVDRARPVAFTFAGRRYEGLAGDTVASALHAAGVRVLARSFKYRRPRGLAAHGEFDAGTLLQMGPEPNLPADRLPLVTGLPPLEPVNVRGTLARDSGVWTDALSRFLPVGFYYRAFLSRPWDWRAMEGAVRRMAGLGTVDTAARHAPTEKAHLFCDVAVIGAGPAGLAAAHAAAAAGAEVVLVEAGAVPGGAALWHMAGTFPGCEALAEAVAANPAVRLLTGAVAQGLFEDHWLGIETRDRYWKLRAAAVVVATGVADQPLVFRNNDLPGVMLSATARRLLHLYGARPGTRVVVAACDDDGIAAALDLLDAGIALAAVADLRGKQEAGPLHAALGTRGIAVRHATAPWEALGPRTAFGGPLKAVRLARADGQGGFVPDTATLACDTLVHSAGTAPLAGLACHVGARLAWNAARGTLAVQDVPVGVFLAGAVAGIDAPAEVVADGAAVGALAAAAALGRPAPEAMRPRPAAGGERPSPVIRHPKGREFVDLDEDLTIRDIENAIADGFAHPEHLKRYTTAAMGPSQGRQAAPAVLRVAAAARGLAPEDFAPTTSRPPFTGERMGLLAGRTVTPTRYTTMQASHVALGAQFMPAGAWVRPAWYGAPDGAEAAVAAEVRAVREGVGLIDVSTLGGIEVRGPDAAAFLDRIYTTPHLKQPVGRGRYAVLCDEAGAIVDDGVACRLAEDHFYVTATTGNADATWRALTWWQAQWAMNVDIANATGAFAAVNIAGPLARTVLAPLAEGVDLAGQAFAYMEVRSGRVAGIAARLLRVGFVGELGYEIHVPMADGEALWEALMAAGGAAGIRPFGVEAQRLLRLEKGHVIIGQDTDGLSTPHEAGMEWAVGKTKPDYIGRAAHRARAARGLDRVLAGFRLRDPGAEAPEECCLVIDGSEIAGRVTSAARSVACGGIVVGLAYLPPARAAIGSTFVVRRPTGAMVEAEVAKAPFYDPDNARQAL